MTDRAFGVPRVGVDLVPIARAEELVRPDREPVLSRMLGPAELGACTRHGRLDPSAVAGFLAVKEAVFKLFHQRDRPVPWRSMRVSGGAGAWPEIHLDGTAAAMAAAAGLSPEISVSIAHDGAYAVAVAASIAQCEKGDTVTQQAGAPIDAIRNWILDKHADRTEVAADEDLIENRLVDSLSFVEFVFLIGETAGVEIDLDTLDINDVRTLDAIAKRYLAA